MSYSHIPTDRLLELQETVKLRNGGDIGFLICGEQSTHLRVEKKKSESDISLLYTFLKNSVNSVLTYVITDALFVTISL